MRTGVQKLVIYKSKIPFTMIEYGGYSSDNSFIKSYFEYINNF